MPHPVDPVAILERPFECAVLGDDQSRWGWSRRLCRGGRDVYPGEIVMGPDGICGEVVNARGGLVTCRPLVGYDQDETAAVEYPRAEVIILDRPGDVLTTAERESLESIA